ncbi:hypothetical protein ACVJMZ_006233 [Sinorhizobium medicae]
MPLLTLGIPTSATAAVMLSAFQSYGINPGPQLLTSHADLVWTLIASLYIGNVMLLILNLPLVGLWVQILRIPTPYLYGGILLFATVGTYGISRSVFDLVMLYAIGLAGFFMRRYDFSDQPRDHRHDPRTPRRAAVPPGHDHVAGGSLGLRRKADFSKLACTRLHRPHGTHRPVLPPQPPGNGCRLKAHSGKKHVRSCHP